MLALLVAPADAVSVMDLCTVAPLIFLATLLA
jgi:hypothetical protein